MTDKTIFPLQPIIDGRFVPNRIVQALLETSTLDLNVIASMDFTDQEHMQLAQLIGYSLSGFSELDYVDDETYASACDDSNPELIARNKFLRERVDVIAESFKKAACELYKVHQDDLENS